MLPVAGLEIEGRYQAADLDVRAGGDFFDVFPLGPERTAVIIGDIAGHGRAAAEASRSVRALVHRELARAAGPADVLTAVEAELVADGTSTMVTLLCAEIDTGHDVVRMASAGHCWPVIRRASGLVELFRQARHRPSASASWTPPPGGPWSGRCRSGPGIWLCSTRTGWWSRRRTPLDAVLGWVQDAIVEHGDPSELCQRLLAVAATQRDHDDDIAVLIVRRAVAADGDDRIQAVEERV